MKRRRSNAGLFERLRGPSSVSYRGELQRRRTEARKQARMDAMRSREREREELKRERDQIREANRLKRKLLKEEAQERRLEAKRAHERKAEEKQSRVSASAIERAYQRGAKTLGEAMEMVERGNPGKASYRGRSVAELEHIRPFVDLRTVDNDWKVRFDARKELEELDHYLKLSRKREAKKASANPRGKKGDFARCVKAVSQRGGASDPNAVCAVQERKKYGQKELTRRAKAGKRTQTRGKRNPADAAKAVSEEFHGRKVKAMIPVQQKRHYHKYLAELGELRKLVVESRDGKHRVTLTGFDGAMLTANEDKNQLFITGGDQSVNLKDFGINSPHEVETLGEVTKIEYFTDKEHLGSEGGTATYVHKFRTTNGLFGHKTLKMARNPDLIYHLRDEHLEFSGGSYEIKPEGIDK